MKQWQLLKVCEELRENKGIFVTTNPPILSLEIKTEWEGLLYEEQGVVLAVVFDDGVVDYWHSICRSGHYAMLYICDFFRDSGCDAAEKTCLQCGEMQHHQ